MGSSAHLAPETYQAVLESLPVGVYLVDRDRRIIFWNDGCERLTGFLRHEVIGRCCADDFLMHFNEHNVTLCGEACPLVDTMHDGRPRESDLFLRHKNGQRVPVRVRSVAVRNEDGGIIGACECFDERQVFLTAGHGFAGAHPSLDQQTQLPGSRTFRRHLEGCLLDLQKSHVPFGLLMVAIDNLDQLRAKDGNNVLASVFYSAGQTLAKSIGPGNLAGRWSATRLAATLGGCSAEILQESAVLLQRVTGFAAVPWWGNRLSFSVSIGGSVAHEDDSLDALVQRAEAALRNCVEKGGNQAAVV
ncbi:MAG TPA: PAS domain-containing protein [Bryobacteraceae bacterium]|nr:PAS domain-containing protein [Bryobacteraceae bacterium]